MKADRQRKQVQLGSAETQAVVMVFIGTRAFLSYPRNTVEAAATAGWMIPLLGAVISALLWLIVSDLLGRFPGKPLAVISIKVLGPYLGLAVNVILILYYLISNSVLLRLFSDTVIITALPDAPISSLTFLFIIPIAFAVYQGLEPLSRSTFIALPFILAGTLAVLAALYPFWDLNQIMPLLGNGPVPLLLNGALDVSTFGDVLILAHLAPFFSFSQKELKRVGFFCLGAVAIVFSLIIMVYLMVLPVTVAEENLVPFYQLSRTIYLGRYFQRVEAVFILFWTFTAFLRLALGFFVTALIFKQTLKLPYYRPLVPALTVLFIALALTPRDLITTIEINVLIRQYFSGFITFGLAVFIWLIALLRGKGEKNEAAKE